MKRQNNKQAGFTLIELLIVVAILGVLAAVAVPNVSRFIGRGETEARLAEKATIQSAVQAMMIDTPIATLSANTLYTADNATSNMSAFPNPAHPLYPLYMQSQNSKYLYYADVNGSVTQNVTGTAP